MSYYKYCIVPKCKSTSLSTPDKIFINVPKNQKVRTKWCKVMKRQDSLSAKSARYCCEDHFELEKDIENYIRYKMMGGRIFLKPGVMPHIFECQKEKKTSQERPGAEKRRRIEYYEKLLGPEMPQALASQPTEFADCANEDVAVEEYLDENIENATNTIVKKLSKNTCDKSTQLSLKKRVYVRSRGTNTDFLNPKDVEKNKQKFEDLTEISASSNDENDLSYDSKTPLISDESFQNDESTSNEEFSRQMKKCTVMAIQQNPKLFLGLPKESYVTIKLLCKFMKRPETEIMITLRKIRLNEPYSILAIHFGITSSAVGKIFRNTLPLIASCMKELIYFPLPNDILINLPLTFRKRFSKVQCIIDCFEIEIEKSSRPSVQALTWSEYKSCNTIKYLISITPDGTINFVSKGYGGRTSDATIFEECGLLDKIKPPGDILADRGFKNIAHLLERQGCALLRPPTVSVKSKPTKEDVIATKRIAAVRIHVERSIGRLRDFNMISPHACVNIQHVKLLDFIVITACGIVNLQKPILPVM